MAVTPQPLIPLIIHEPRPTWARQLRPRSADWPVRITESRTSDQIRVLAQDNPFGLLLIDLADRPLAGLDALAEVRPFLGGWLTLVIDPTNDPALQDLARELGATDILSHPLPPPRVAAQLQRWTEILIQRRASVGWLGDTPNDLDTWLALLLAPTLS